MSTNNTYLAVFLGSKTSARRAAWDALPESGAPSKGERRDDGLEGVGRNARGRHRGHGRAIGKTKKVSSRGIADTSNEMGAFTVVRAESHEAAAKLFERHPHFSIFPGDAVEIMPVLPIPGAA